MISCAECGGPADLTDGRVIYPHRPDLAKKSFWLCKCGAYCGCHPGTTSALGSPAGPDTRRARSAAHAAFDPLWRSGEMTRNEAYTWLAQSLGIPQGRCHIGMMTADEARRVITRVTQRAFQSLGER
jgi:hypothetical protein